MEENKQINIEVEKNNKKFYFVMPDNCPVGDAYDACHLVLNRIVELAQQIADKAKRVQDDVVEAELVDKGN